MGGILEKKGANQKKGSLSLTQKGLLEKLPHCQILQTSQFWRALPYLESSPLFDSNCSTDIISSNSVNYDQSTHQNNVVRVNTTSRSDAKVVSLDIYFKCS